MMTANLLLSNEINLDQDASGLMEKISLLAKQISLIEEKKSLFIQALRFLKYQDLDFISSLINKELEEKQLVKKVNPANLTGLTVAGVDGGLISKTFHNLDLFLTRAVTCIFNFQKDRPIVKYLTSESPTPSLHHNLKPLNHLETDIFSTLERIKCEIELAISIFDHTTPEAILLDGSILPLPGDRPNSLTSPPLYRKYQDLLKKFELLYESCLNHGTILAGCIKDTRSIRFVKFLGRLIPNLFPFQDYLDIDLSCLLDLNYRDIIDLTRDTELLFDFLEVGERTAVMNYFENHNTIYHELDGYFADRIKLFYLKTVKYDIPMRVEVLSLNGNPINTVRKISSILFPLSSYHAKYGVPTVLIEADARAKLNETDLDMIYDMLCDSVPGSVKLLKLRRHRRPF